MIVNLILSFLFGFVSWSLQTQICGFAFAQCKVVNHPYDTWKPYASLGTGAIIANLIWKIITPLLNLRYPELWYTKAAAVSVFISCFMFISYSPMGSQDPPPLLYAGTAFLSLGSTWFFANNEIQFSKQITTSHEEVGSSYIILMSAFGVAASFARFLGPLVSGSALAIEDSVVDPSTGQPTPTCLVDGVRDTANSDCCVSSLSTFTRTRHARWPE